VIGNALLIDNNTVQQSTASTLCELTLDLVPSFFLGRAAYANVVPLRTFGDKYSAQKRSMHRFSLAYP
jgi:hypothetical protein